jgi:hypothetical protein
MRAGGEGDGGGGRGGRGGDDGAVGGTGEAHDAVAAARLMSAPLPLPPWHTGFDAAAAAAVGAEFDACRDNALEVRGGGGVGNKWIGK